MAAIDRELREEKERLVQVEAEKKAALLARTRKLIDQMRVKSTEMMANPELPSSDKIVALSFVEFMLNLGQHVVDKLEVKTAVV